MISAIVLAAGKSERMGKPKLLMPFAQNTILEQTVDNILRSAVNETIVVLGDTADEISAKLSGRAVRFIINKDYEKGIDFLARVVEAHPDTIYAAESLYQMGLAYHRGMMDLERAEEYYRQYLGNFPGHEHKPKARRGLADCLYWQDRFEEALRVYAELYEESPQEDWVPYQMMMCRYHLGQYAECRLVAEEFVRSRPKSSYAPSMLYRVAECYEQEENWQAAGETYNRLVDSHPLHQLRWSAKRDLARLADRLPSPTPTPPPGSGAPSDGDKDTAAEDR